MQITDNVFALHLANSMPGDFPDISTSLEGHLLLESREVISMSDVCRALGAMDVRFRRRVSVVEAMKMSVNNDLSTEGCRCNYCDI